MFEDLKLAVGDGVPVDFLGSWGGIVPTEIEIEQKVQTAGGNCRMSQKALLKIKAGKLESLTGESNALLRRMRAWNANQIGRVSHG